MVLMAWTNSISDWINFFVVQWYMRLKFIFLKILAFLSICVVLFWLSMFMYGSFYYVYMPSVSHSWPVHLQFRSDCEEEIGRLCSRPQANFSLLQHADSTLLMQGQAYVIVIELMLPESPINREIGMFTVLLELYSHYGETVRSSLRSALLIYKSPLLQTLETLVFLPKLLFVDGTTQSQRLLVTLFEDYYEHPFKPTQGALVAINNRHIQIYSSVLYIYAKFTGLRYVMFHWPLVSMLVGITCNMFFLSIVAFVSWYRFVVEPQLGAMNTQRQQYSQQQQEQRRLHARSLLDQQRSRHLRGAQQQSVVPSSSAPNLLPLRSTSPLQTQAAHTAMPVATLSYAELNVSEDNTEDSDMFYDSQSQLTQLSDENMTTGGSSSSSLRRRLLGVGASGGGRDSFSPQEQQQQPS